MADDGDYPFVTEVRNTFKKESEIYFLVKHFHYSCYNKKRTNNNQNELQPFSYKIRGGGALCFPLYWRAENLEIRLNNIEVDGKYYYFWCGPKALCRMEYHNCDKIIAYPPKPLTFEEEIFIKEVVLDIQKEMKSSVDYKYYRGGVWKLKNDKNTPITHYRLKIRKWVHDPEDEPVTISPDPPG